MKFLKKTIAVTLSLALGAGLTLTPAFAASFSDLQGVIDNQTSLMDEKHNVRIGYDAGNITLNEDITREEDEGSIKISGEDTDVTLHLNGHTIDGAGKGGSVITVNNGAHLALDGADKAGNKGIITGGNTDGNGGGINVAGGKADLDNVIIKGNEAASGGGISVGDIFEWRPEENGEVSVHKGELTVKNSVIEENTATEFGGGGIGIQRGESDKPIEIVNTQIVNNKAQWGGAICVPNSDVVLDGVTVTGNKTLGDNGPGGILFDVFGEGQSYKITMKNGTAVYGNISWVGTEWEGDNDLFVRAQDGGTATIEGDTSATNNGKTFDGWTYQGDNIDKEPTFTISAGTGKWRSESVSSHWAEPEQPPVDPTDPVDPVDPTEPDDTGIEVEEPLIPLASGPVTRAQFIDYLWRHEGEPETDGVCTFTDVPEDHEYVLALAWAEQSEVAFPYEDGAFEPDELVTVGAVREFLDNFAKVFGTNVVAAADLKSLSGAADEAVLNCGQVLAEFFGEPFVMPDAA